MVAENNRSAFEARRRRKNRNRDGHSYPSSSGYNTNDNNSEENPVTNGRKGRGRRGAKTANNNNNNKKQLPKEEADPYDSDPGESYRDHCDRIQDERRSKSCLAIPRFLKDGKKFGKVANNNLKVKVQNINGDIRSGATEPPSPLLSEPDVSKNMPSSLPRDLARVRYSLRTSIGDGTEKQPGASATTMERRELRPNNIHINVSHWSDFGGRNYMEDR